MFKSIVSVIAVALLLCGVAFAGFPANIGESASQTGIAALSVERADSLPSVPSSYSAGIAQPSDGYSRAAVGEYAKNNTYPQPAYMKLSPEKINVLEGQSVQFYALLYSQSGTLIAIVAPSAVQWSVSGGIGTIDGNGVFRAASSGTGAVQGIYDYVPGQVSFTAAATVAVSSITPPPPPANNSTYLEIIPPSASLIVGQTQQFAAVFHMNGSAAEVPAQWSYVGDECTITDSGLLSAVNPGSGKVVAIYGESPINIGYVAEAPVEVSSNLPPNATYLELVPSSANLTVGQSQQFVAVLHTGPGGAYATEIPPSQINWSVNDTAVGTIAGTGIFTAAANGSALVSAIYGNATPTAYLATATVQVGQGTATQGGAGGGSAGGAYKTSTVASFTCAGRAATIKVTYLVSTELDATVDIYYLGAKNAKVASKTLGGTGSFEFTPEKEGRYEVRVSLGVNQASAYFTVPSCTAGQPITEQNVTVSLKPGAERVLTKTVDYQNGFTKKFEVWRATDTSGTDRYRTDITLTYTGRNTVYNATVQDFLPKGVVASSSQVVFEKRPSSTGETSGSLEFKWQLASVVKNERLTYKYSFARPLTEQMIDSFPPPQLLAGPAPIPQQGGTGGVDSMLAAALSGLSGFNLWIVLVVVLVAAAAIYLFVFRKKKE